MKYFVLPVLLLFVAFASGCVGQGEEAAFAKTLQEKYDAVQSYTATYAITYPSGAAYQEQVSVKKPDMSKSVSECQNRTYICSGSTRYVTYPEFGVVNEERYENNICAESIVGPDYFNVLKQLSQVADVKLLTPETINGKLAFVFELTARQTDAWPSKYKIWADQDTYWPLKIEEYKDGKLLFTEEYTDFKSNAVLTDDDFKPPSELKTVLGSWAPAYNETGLQGKKEKESWVLLSSYNKTKFKEAVWRSAPRDAQAQDCSAHDYMIEYSLEGEDSSIVIIEAPYVLFDQVHIDKFDYKPIEVPGFEAWALTEGILLKRPNGYYSIGTTLVVSNGETQEQVQTRLYPLLVEFAKSLQ